MGMAGVTGSALEVGLVLYRDCQIAMVHGITDLFAIASVFSQDRGGPPVFLIPTHEFGIVAELYRWGARNVELHFAQVRGPSAPPDGIIMPSFLPESG